MEEKMFKILNGSDEDVLGGSVGLDNVYVSVYGAVVEGQKHPRYLEVGERTILRYSLSGQKPTCYHVLRVS